MKKYSSIILVAITLIALGVLYYFQHSFPMQFLFLTTIILSVSYFFINNVSIAPGGVKNERNISLLRQSRPFAVGCLLLVFFVSILTIRRYQLPSEDAPYFNNTSYHGIKNKGIAFKDNLVLFDEENKKSGIWPSDTGTFSILHLSDSRFRMEFKHFLTPVFCKEGKSTFLLNPIFNTPVGNDFSINDNYTSLTWSDFENHDPDNSIDPEYSFKITFKTRNKALLRELGEEKNASFTTSLSLPKKEIKRGMLLRALISEMKSEKSEKSDSSDFNDLIVKWIESKSPNVYLLNVKNGSTNGMQLSFFASSEFFLPEKHMEVKSRNSILSINDYNVEFNGIDNDENYKHFFVGFSNANKLLGLQKTKDQNEINNLEENTCLLTFDYPSYYSLESNVNRNSIIGNGEIRFLKNNFGSGDSLMRAEEGFFFHDNVKTNANTAVDAYISYFIGKPGDSLKYKLVNFSSNTGFKNAWFNENGQNEFVLNSAGDLKWLFEINDFSDSGFSYNKLLTYLGIIMLFFITLVIFFPSLLLRRIEVPILLIAYTLLVFRFVLLWRIATFPPMNEISGSEFDTLRQFDFKLFGLGLPLPFTLIISVLLVAILMFFRFKDWNFNELFNKLDIRSNKKLLPVYFHVGVLVFGFLFKISGNDFLIRIGVILIPIVSYFFFSGKVIENGQKFEHIEIKTRIRPLKFLIDLFKYWIETPIFFLSLSTFIFLLMFDRGFSLIFLFYLLLKNVFVNFSRYNRTSRNDNFLGLILKPSNYWIYGLLSFILYLIIVYDKGFFSELLSNINYLICFFAVSAIIATYLITSSNLIKKIVTSICILIIVFSLVFPKTISGIVESNLKNTIYRTKIFTESVESILMNFEYNSSEEKKLIETAQNHWYIENYINNPNSDNSALIKLRPHFNTAVNYSTQTRDVVLPRYVISEFGSLMMALCIILLAIPMLLYFLNFRITPKILNSQKLISINKGSYVGLSALILLFTIGLFVWLTSTNRIVFFGQDFPFISLTSKLSVLFPLLLLIIVLSQKPEERVQNQVEWKPLLFRILFFGLITFVFIWSSKNEHQFTKFDDKHFKPEFNDIKQRVKEVNKVLDSIQDVKFKDQFNLDEFSNTNDIIDQNAITYIFSKLKSTSSYTSLITSDNKYFSDIMGKLQDNFRMGFRSSSPIYILFDDVNNKYQLAFNNTLHIEEPPYDVKNDWKGSVVSDYKSPGNNLSEIKYVNSSQANPDAVKFIMIPSSYTGDTSAVGILNFGDIKNPNNSFSVFHNHGDTKSIVDYELGKIPIRNLKMKLSDVFINRTFNNSFTISKNERVMSLNEDYGINYFAKNYIINGRQRFVYPLGAAFPWISNWTDEQKQLNKNNKKNDTLFIDFNLTEKVNQELITLKKIQLIDGMAFSVIAADGDGRIRLMSDYCKQRKIINPNNTQEIAQQKNEEYFIVNSKRESIQWGNKNLIQMDLGPGSSIKPIIAAAVASEVNAGWEKLSLNTNSQVVVKPGINYYAGCRIHPVNRNKGWREKHSNAPRNFVDYLAHSDNMYHSILMFMGSYERSDFGSDGNAPSLTYKILKNHPEDSLSLFPEMRITGNGPNFYFNSINKSFNNWPVYSKLYGADTNNISFFGSENSILKDALYKNINLKINYDERGTSQKIKSAYSSEPINNSVTTLNPLAYPDFSFFPLEEMRMTKSEMKNYLFQQKFINPVRGSAPYQVTPYKMAEIFGNLANQNTNYSLSISKSNFNQKPYRRWSVDNSWAGKSFDDFLKNQIFTGMGKVFSNIGTGAPVYTTNSNNGYFLYGKTGTTGSSDGINYKRLAIIISKNDLTQNISNDNKYFVVYFNIEKAAYEHSEGWYWKYFKNITDLVINSDSFKEYMK
jgi:hypothetical protein